MSAPHHLPQRHLNLLPNSAAATAPLKVPFSVRPNIAERFSRLLHEIEVFLQACTYEEICKFWKAIAHLRHCLQNCTYPSEVPQFLTIRRRQRDFSRILEVLADLTYPQMHLSSYVTQEVGNSDRKQSKLKEQAFPSIYPHLAIQK